MPASLSKVFSVDGAMPTPSCVPKGKAGERGGRAYLGLIRVSVGNGGSTGGSESSDWEGREVCHEAWAITECGV